MKFSCNRTEMVKALNIVGKAVSTRSTMEILKGILVEADASTGTVTLSASDLEISIKKQIDAVVERPGQAVLTARLFTDIVRKLPDSEVSVEMSTESPQVIIKSGKSKFDIVCFPANEFPAINQVKDATAEVSFDAEIFKGMVGKTSFAASTDASRGVLTGILTEINGNNVRMVSVDGYRLAVNNKIMDGEGNWKFIVSAKTMTEICKIINDESGTDVMHMTMDEKMAYLLIGGTTVILRLMEGAFIDYEKLIPNDSQTRVMVNKKALYSCLERASLFSTEGKNNLIKVETLDGELIITSQSDAGNIKEQVPAMKSGGDVTIGFNSKFVMDVLKSIDDNEIVLNMKGSQSPCVITPTEGTAYTYLVLPVRI